ncbi:MAG: membrane protein insertase YidC [Planctomycetota bacterium]|nr:membrane protein insertase YidC [Planctomycetota bacterium]
MPAVSRNKEPVDWVKFAGVAAAIAFLIVWQAFIYPWYLSRGGNGTPAGGPGQGPGVAGRGGDASGASGRGMTEIRSGADEARRDGPEAGASVGGAGTLPPEADPEEPVRVSTGLLELVFDNRGATLARATLLDARVRPGSNEPLDILGEIQPDLRSMALTYITVNGAKYEGLDSRRWKRTSGPVKDADGAWIVGYQTDLGTVRLTKRFRVPEDGRHVELEISVENAGKEPAKYDYRLRGAAGILPDLPPDEKPQQFYPGVSATLAGRREEGGGIEYMDVDPAAAAAGDPAKRRLSLKRNMWAATRNRFFAAVLIPFDPGVAIEMLAEAVRPDASMAARDSRFRLPNLATAVTRRLSGEVAPGQTGDPDRYALYLGPAKDDILASYDAGHLGMTDLHLNAIITYFYHWESINWISRQLLRLFNLIHSAIDSYGLAVVLLTLAVKLALHPFQKKSTIAMHRMQQIQPLLMAIKQKYEGKKDAESQRKMHLETMDLMNKHGANPAMGCLPVLVQMPIFFALYGTFSRAFEIRHAGFLYIADLSVPDRLAMLPFWPGELNLLPILYCGLMLYQSSKMPKPTDPNQELNYKMMKIMPVVFSVLFYMMPSGLVVYFVASSIFGLVETWYIKKRFCPDTPAAAGATGVAGAAGVPAAMSAAPAGATASAAGDGGGAGKAAKKAEDKPK